jgi:hypothetical protein
LPDGRDDKSGRRRVGVFSRMDAGRVIDIPAGAGAGSI